MCSLHRNNIIEEDVQAIVRQPHPWEKLAGKRILVTGASGLIGAYLVETLTCLNETGQQAPFQVLAMARNEQRLQQRFSHLRGREDFLPIIHDVSLPLPRVGQLDYIVHAASNANPVSYLRDPMGTIQANVLGVMNLLEIARTTGGRLLFLSSGAVYGESTGENAISEFDFGASDPCDPRACYGESKRLGESLCCAAFRQHGVDALIARISHTYGPGADLSDGRVFSDFIADAVAGRDICVKSDGQDRRPFCYVADTAAALLLLLLEGKGGEAYNVGTDEEMSIADLARLIAGLNPEKPSEVVFAPHQKIANPAPRSQGHFDIAKIGALGWAPSMGPVEGFRRMYDYFAHQVGRGFP